MDEFFVAHTLRCIVHAVVKTLKVQQSFKKKTRKPRIANILSGTWNLKDDYKVQPQSEYFMTAVIRPKVPKKTKMIRFKNTNKAYELLHQRFTGGRIHYDSSYTPRYPKEQQNTENQSFALKDFYKLSKML